MDNKKLGTKINQTNTKPKIQYRNKLHVSVNGKCKSI